MPQNPSVKISLETRQDLKDIQEILVKRGIQILPKEFREIVRSIDESVTQKVVIAIAVKFLKELVVKIDEAHTKAGVKTQ